MNSKQRRQWARKMGYSMQHQQVLVTEARLMGVIRNPATLDQWLQGEMHHRRIMMLMNLETLIAEAREEQA